MATIKDIAQRAGVSHGTVSNVLNGKGNVSSEKMQRVLKAAEELGYTANEIAKLLRKGSSNTLAVMLPGIQSGSCAEFFLGVKSGAEQQGYSVQLYLTQDNPKTELDIIEQSRAALAAGAVVISCLDNPEEAYMRGGYAAGQLVFAERKPPGGFCGFLGMDYAEAGREMARAAAARGHRGVALLTGDLRFSCERDFYTDFETVMREKGRPFVHLQTDMRRKTQNVLELFRAAEPEAAVLSDYGMAETVKDVWKSFYGGRELNIYTVSPVFTMPEHDFNKFEMNYRLMGVRAARMLIENLEGGGEPRAESLAGYGFQQWFSSGDSAVKADETIRVLMLDSPDAPIMQHLARLYADETGVRVEVDVRSYGELYDCMSDTGEGFAYDVVRLDVVWLPWFAQKILLPLEELDPGIGMLAGRYLPGVWERYAYMQGRVYALPAAPSTQLLFFRTDLFESTVLRRLYRELTKKPLAVPDNFAQFQDVAAFFTRARNPESPVPYGATLTVGGSGVACSEFLARFYAAGGRLFDQNGRLQIDRPPAGDALRELLRLRGCAPPQPSRWWKDTALSFARGETAMAILYSNYASDLLGKASKIVGKIGCAPLPGNWSLIGGGSLGIYKGSNHAEAALRFLKWMCGEQVASASALLGGASACRRTYENYEIMDAYPWMPLVERGFLSGANPEPWESEGGVDTRQLYRLIGHAVRRAFEESYVPEQALREAGEAYAELGRRPAPVGR